MPLPRSSRQGFGFPEPAVQRTAYDRANAPSGTHLPMIAKD
jgi:hypothetical protein